MIIVVLTLQVEQLMIVVTMGMLERDSWVSSWELETVDVFPN
jgi:hypothetical protein